ncbi:MAG: hypothetical protein JW866_09835, partial [Ignavibacteriales bacterium]|nr:hypothetical protein [Ignavibacteriales bacterium]
QAQYKYFDKLNTSISTSSIQVFRQAQYKLSGCCKLHRSSTKMTMLLTLIIIFFATRRLYSEKSMETITSSVKLSGDFNKKY